MTPDQYTALYAQVQVLTNQMQEARADLRGLRDTAAPQERLVEAERRVSDALRQIRALRDVLDAADRTEAERQKSLDRRADFWKVAFPVIWATVGALLLMLADRYFGLTP